MFREMQGFHKVLFHNTILSLGYLQKMRIENIKRVLKNLLKME
jgi:hypothetical protein